MIGIVDSGSTKADFVILDDNGIELKRLRTAGFNPLFITAEEVSKALIENSTLISLASEIKEIHFFGAGCRSAELNKIIKDGFLKVFNQAQLKVESDLLAACYAVYDHHPTMVGILGTGSNSCYFDGQNVVKKTPSIGFILGDEGAGNHIGRSLLRAYYTNKLPEDLKIKFTQKYNLSVQELLENIHRKAFPNAYLASFNEFAYEHRKNEFVKDLIQNCFREYFIYQVEPYDKYDCKEISFIGSIAFYYQNLIQEVAEEFGFKVNKCLQKPIDGLVEYFSR